MRGMVTWLLVLLFTVPIAALGQHFSIGFEGERVWQARNEVQVPNTTEGTRFSLVDLAEKNAPWSASRGYITLWNSFRLVAAPLEFDRNILTDETIHFAGMTVPPGIPAAVHYRLDSYRFTYRYGFFARPLQLWLGLTAAYVDAEVRLEQSGVVAKKTERGIIPLLHLAGEFPAASRLGILFDADGLAVGPGNIVDATVKLYLTPVEWLRIAGGYRILSGRVDMEEVYNAVRLDYAVLSVELRL